MRRFDWLGRAGRPAEAAGSATAAADGDAWPAWRAKLRDTLTRPAVAEGDTSAATPAWQTWLRDTVDTVGRAIEQGAPDADAAPRWLARFRDVLPNEPISAADGESQPVWRARLREKLVRAAVSVQQSWRGNDLAHQFDREARSLPDLTRDSVTQVLLTWEARLAGNVAAIAGPLQAAPLSPDSALTALIHSNAIITAVEGLTMCPELRSTLLVHRAASDALAEVADEKQAGAVLLRLLGRVSSLPAESLGCLLTLLAEAQAALDRNLAPGGHEAAATSSARTLWWAKMLLAAAVADGEEAELLRDASLARAVGLILSDEGGDSPTRQPDQAQGATGEADLMKRSEACSGRCAELRALLLAHQARRSSRPATSTGPNSDAASASARAPEFDGALKVLRELREERVGHIAKLGQEVARCASVEEGFQSQMRTSSDSYREELDALQNRRSDAMDQIKELQLERSKLQKQLQEVEEKLQAAEISVRELQVNEDRLKGNMDCLSQEFIDRLSSEGQRQEEMAEERRLISVAQNISAVVENGINARATATTSAANELRAVGDVGLTVVAAYALCSQSSMHALEELWRKSSAQLQAARNRTLSKEELYSLKTTVDQAASTAEKAYNEASSLLSDGAWDENASQAISMLSDIARESKKLADQFRGAAACMEAPSKEQHKPAASSRDAAVTDLCASEAPSSSQPVLVAASASAPATAAASMTGPANITAQSVQADQLGEPDSAGYPTTGLKSSTPGSVATTGSTGSATSGAATSNAAAVQVATAAATAGSAGSSNPANASAVNAGMAGAGVASAPAASLAAASAVTAGSATPPVAKAAAHLDSTVEEDEDDLGDDRE